MLIFFRKHCHYIYLALILLVSAAIYTPYYGEPHSMFWDENYHIASAQKYVDEVMYMEPHPPLGKLLMGASESILGLNEGLDKSNFSHTDYLKDKDVPDGLSFYGYRLPSTFLMMFSVLFFFGIVRLITQNMHVAAVFTGFMIFDNALVIHARSAMLDGIQLFFILGAIYFLVKAVTEHVAGKAITLKNYAILGVFIGLATAVKINGLILLLLFVVLFVVDAWDSIKKLDAVEVLKRLGKTVPAGMVPLLLVMLSIFYVHIELGNSMPNHKDYKASSEYKNHIKEGLSVTPSSFYIAMKDNLAYMAGYADGVPRLDVCKDGENGSPAYAWPLGIKAINYRWSRNTVDGVSYTRYHTLAANPVVWFSVMIGIILSLGLIISRFVYDNEVKDAVLFKWICVFTGLYISYMITMLQIERVMYLYHYLVPLTFGSINLALVYTYIFQDGLVQRRRHTYINLGCFLLFVVGVFAVLSPFTYSFQVSAEGFELRNWFTFGVLGGASS